MAFATTPVAKAQVQAKLAQRRVEEAEVLAAKGALTASASAKLAVSFEAHAQAAAELSDHVAKEDPDTGASLKADLDSSLAAHGAILATLGHDTDASPDDHAGAQGPEMGALPTLMAATADLPGGTYVGPSGPGEFRGYPQVVRPSRLARDESAQRRMWEISEATVGWTWPGGAPSPGPRPACPWRAPCTRRARRRPRQRGAATRGRRQSVRRGENV